MATYGSIFEVNSRVVKLWDLLGHFDKKDKVDFDKYYLLILQFYNIVHANNNCIIFISKILLEGVITNRKNDHVWLNF